MVSTLSMTENLLKQLSCNNGTRCKTFVYVLQPTYKSHTYKLWFGQCAQCLGTQSIVLLSMQSS